jgi:hypothetical protein
MPKPVRKNQESIKVLPNIIKEVSFNEEAYNIMSSSKDFSFSHTSVPEGQDNSEKSISASIKG